MLDGDFATILLAKKSSNYWYGLLAESMARNVVGNCEKHQRVKDGMQLGALLARDEWVGATSLHYDDDSSSFDYFDTTYARREWLWQNGRTMGTGR